MIAGFNSPMEDSALFYRNISLNFRFLKKNIFFWHYQCCDILISMRMTEAVFRPALHKPFGIMEAVEGCY
jgi:hypothetical protein